MDSVTCCWLSSVCLDRVNLSYALPRFPEHEYMTQRANHDFVPLILRLAGRPQEVSSDVALEPDPLPPLVEVTPEGCFVAQHTRLTKIDRETTDDY